MGLASPYGAQWVPGMRPPLSAVQQRAAGFQECDRILRSDGYAQSRERTVAHAFTQPSAYARLISARRYTTLFVQSAGAESVPRTTVQFVPTSVLSGCAIIRTWATSGMT